MEEHCDECGKKMKNPYAEIDYGVYLCQDCYEEQYGEDIDDGDPWGDDGKYNSNMED